MFQVVEKVCFFRNVAYSQTLTPNPFPSGRAVYALLALRLCNRGRLLSVRPAPTLFDHLYASLHRAFGHTRPASVPGLNVGLPPSPSKDACSQSHTVAVQGRITTATQSRCTMQRHQRLTTCIRATPKARTLWLLAKSFARCKTNIASNAKHPFLKIV